MTTELETKDKTEKRMFPDMVPLRIQNEVVTALVWPLLKAQALEDDTPVFKHLTANAIVQMAEGDKRPTKAFMRYVRIQMRHHANELREGNIKHDPRHAQSRNLVATIIERWVKEITPRKKVSADGGEEE